MTTWEHPPRTASAGDHYCELATYHAPAVVIVEYHHRRPVYLQNRLYGKIVYADPPNMLWLCSNCHEAVHAWLYWLLRERREPVNVGRLAKDEAYRTYAWYLSEKVRLGT